MNRAVLAKGKPSNVMLMKERQLAEISANVCLVLKNQQAMLAVLECKPSKKTAPQIPPSKSKRLPKEGKRRRNELKKRLPKYLTTQETADELGILPSNFYRNVYKKILFPVFPNGCKHPRYHRSKVINVVINVVHEPGAHTYSKLNNKSK